MTVPLIESADIRAWLAPLKKTVFHPQYLSYRDNVLREWLTQISPRSVVLDIGCNDRWPESAMPHGCQYIGLDYFVSGASRYASLTDIYGDAQRLPLQDNSIDVVLLFDVLEHIPNATLALQEVRRVLRPSGEVLVQVPFMYPIHDAPMDFRRPTIHGWRQCFEEGYYDVYQEASRGADLESAALLSNIAMSSSLLNILKSCWAPLGVVLLPLLFVCTVFNNCLGLMASKNQKENMLMPFSYQFKLSMKDCTDVKV